MFVMLYLKSKQLYLNACQPVIIFKFKCLIVCSVVVATVLIKVKDDLNSLVNIYLL